MPANIEHTFEISARRPASIAAIVAVWVVLAGLFLILNARWWFLAPFAFLTLPAIWDVVRAKVSVLEIRDGAISWRSSSGKSGQVLIANIARVGIRTRLDLSRRVRLYMIDNQATTIPPDCTPQGATMERIFAKLDIKVQREFVGG